VSAAELGIFARVFPPGSAERVAAAVRGSGYTTTQLNLKVLGRPTLPDLTEWDDIDAAEIRSAFDDAGVSVWGVSATYNMCHPDQSVRREGTRRAIAVIEHAVALGAAFVTLCTGSRDAENMWAVHPGNQLPDAWSDMRAELDALLGAARATGIRLGLEPETGAVLDTADTTARLLAELGDDTGLIGIILDPANLLRDQPLPQEEVLLDAFAQLGPHITCLHAKDTRGWDAALRGDGGIDFSLVASLRTTHAPRVPVIVQDVAAEQAPIARRMLAGLFGA